MVRSVLGIGRRLSLVLVLSLAAAGCDDGADGQGGSGGAGASGGAGGAGGETTAGGAGGAGGETTAGGAGGSTQVALGDIAVTIDYAGMETGTLSIAALTSFPPMGPPVAFQQFPMPVFPQMGTLVGLESDKPHYVVATLDIGNDNPQMPGPEDLVALTMMPVDITPNGEVQVQLTLMDK